MQKPRAHGERKKTAYVKLGFWLDDKDRHIHMAGKYITGPGGFISTVSDDPNSERFHHNLYKNLNAVLKKSGK